MLSKLMVIITWWYTAITQSHVLCLFIKKVNNITGVFLFLIRMMHASGHYVKTNCKSRTCENVKRNRKVGCDCHPACYSSRKVNWKCAETGIKYLTVLIACTEAQWEDLGDEFFWSENVHLYNSVTNFVSNIVIKYIK